jgi:hypothetical protein
MRLWGDVKAKAEQPGARRNVMDCMMHCKMNNGHNNIQYKGKTTYVDFIKKMFQIDINIV